MIRLGIILLFLLSSVHSFSLEKLDMISESSSEQLLNYDDLYFPSAFILKKDVVSFTFRYFTGNSEMFNYADSEKLHDADVVGNSFLWSYNPIDRVNVFAGLSTYYSNYSINENATIVKDFDTTYRNILTNVDARLLSIPTLAPVYEVDRRYWKRHYGLQVGLYDFKEYDTKLATGFVQHHSRYQRKTLDIPSTDPSIALIGPIPRTVEDIIYAVENSEIRLWASKHFSRFDLHGGVKIISTETKIDDEKAEFYTHSTLFGRIDYFFNDHFNFRLGADTYGLSTNINYFKDDEFLVSLFYFAYDDDIKGKSSITGYENVRFVRKEKITGITYTKRF